MAPALDNVVPLIESEADLAKLASPNPATAGRMPMVAEIIHLVKEMTGRRPPLCFCGPFTMAAHLMTFENLVVQIRQNRPSSTRSWPSSSTRCWYPMANTC